MKYMQDFGYKVIPINPFAEGEIINGEKVLSGLDKAEGKIDIVDVFRPSKEIPDIAKQVVRIGAKVLWLQYGIHHIDAENMVKKENIKYISNRCIKQEYQKIFQKTNPVYPVLKN